MLGWVLGYPVLASFGPQIPMAPSTALLFILFGMAVLSRVRRPRSRPVYLGGMVLGAIGVLVGLLLFILSSRGIHWGIEHLGIPISGTAAGVPLGHMSPLTAACFVLVGLSFLATLSSIVASPRRAMAAFCLACLIVLGSFVSLIGYLLGTPLLYGGDLIPPALSTSLAFLALGTALFAFSGHEAWSTSAKVDAAGRPPIVGLIPVFLVLVVGIVSAGVFYYRGHAKSFRAEVERQLSAIADLKGGQLVHWREDRLGDAAVFYDNANFTGLVERYLRSPSDEDARVRLETWMRHLTESYRYDRISLYDAAGIGRLEIPPASMPVQGLPAEWTSEVVHSGDVTFRDFYRDELDRRIHLSVLVPILGEENARHVTGILEMRIDPDQYLYPMIGRWPVPSLTAETLIVRRDGDGSLFLNELRFQKGTALNLRVSLDNVQMPAVKAVLGQEGIVDGIDYRGVSVIAAVRSVPDSPWFLVARMDVSEAYGPLRERGRETVGVIAALLLGAGAGVGLVWRHQRARHYRERYHAAEALRGSEEKFAVAFHSKSVLMAIMTIDGTYVEVNESATTFLGFTREELIGKTDLDLGIQADPEAQSQLRRTVQQAGEIHNVETRLRAKDGTPRDGLLSVETIRIRGEPHWLSIITDITELKKAQNQVRKQNRVYAMLSDINQAIVRVRDPQALFERACRVAVDRGDFLLAWIGLVDEPTRRIRVAAAAGRAEGYLEELNVSLADEPRAHCPVDGALREGRPVVCNAIGQDGNLAPCQEVARAHGFRSSASFPLRVSERIRGAVSYYSGEADFFDDEELHLLEELALDISFSMEIAEKEAARKQAEGEHERLEAQFRQAQKMEAVGRLAGGVAHDFNNMLQVINSYAELALKKLEPSDPLRAHIHQIAKAGQRSADLTRQLLAFARQQAIAPKVLDLNGTVASMLEMLRRLIGEDIDLLWKPADNPWPVEMDPSQIDQVLANLVVNARDAIAGVGKITIETGKVEFDQAYCETHVGFVQGQFAMLAVSDDGCGMDKETLARAFEPFFTTKPQGQGTGLGLATVYGIVKQNDGFINVYSESGKGTTFRIYLPRHESEERASEETPSHAETPTGKETVLLVEDEAALLEIGKMLLEELGYSVLAAGGPRQAMELAGEYAGKIDLLLTDVVMPEMGGRDLWHRLGEARPGVKCLFMSGYTADAIAHRGVLDEGIHFLQKPFSRGQLATKIREALSPADTAGGVGEVR